jgi:hypothetical protein
LSKPETKLVHKIMQALGEEFPGAYLRKIHGNPFQHAGIPDIIGCIEGCFIGLEVKTTQGRVSEIQKLEGLSILQADGIHGVVTDSEEAILCVRMGLKSHKINLGPPLPLG